MNDGMKIILERLKTHPEEFGDDSNPFASEGKWTKLIHQYQHNLPKEDVDAFKQAIDEIRQAEFTAKVMEELLDPKLEEQLTLSPFTTKRPNATLSAGTTLGAYANTAVGTTTVTLDDTRLHELLQMKAEIDLERTKKQSKTLFGKLFNYL
jgi:hypothetical protein